MTRWQVNYRAAVGVGVLLVLGGIWSLTDSANDNIGVVLIVMGSVLCLVGWAIRYVHTGKRGLW